MPDRGSAGAGAGDASPVDITQELALNDEGILDPTLPGGHRRWSRRRLTIVAAAAAVLVVAGATTGLVLGLTDGSPVSGLVISTETVTATTGTIQQTVAASGTLEPASQANLDFAVSGTVTAVDVKAGQTVTPGQVLATIDTTALQADLDAAKAQVASADDRLTSDRDSGAAATQIDSDEAAVTSAESSLSTAQTNLADASLTSTISGTVASVSLTVGQLVNGTGSGGGGANNSGSGTGSGSGSSSGSAQIVVIGTSSYIVNTTVDDTQIGQVAAGDQATITPSGATTPDYGTVASISLIANQSSNVASFPVVIDVTGDPGGLYAGDSASISIIVKQLNDVTEVPTTAISYNANSGQAQVVKVVNGQHVTTDVTVGDAQSGETQIVSGVKPGDKVLERVVTFRAPGGGTSGGGIFGNGGNGGVGRFGPGGGGSFAPFGGNGNGDGNGGKSFPIGGG